MRRQLRECRRRCAGAAAAGGAAGSASRHVGSAPGTGSAAGGDATAGPNAGATHLLPVGAAPFRCRITVSGSPVRNLRGVLVVSGHVSWLDVFCIGSVLPGSFVARADMFTGRTIGIVARILKIIPIERASLRRLPGVVDTIARRLRAGQTVVAFPRAPPGAVGRATMPAVQRPEQEPGARIAVVGLSIRRCSRPQSMPAARCSHSG